MSPESSADRMSGGGEVTQKLTTESGGLGRSHLSRSRQTDTGVGDWSRLRRKDELETFPHL